MIKVLVQVEAGSTERFYFDERTLALMGKRQVSRPYPYPYGFILGTRAEDEGCVDCYILTRNRLNPGLIVECEPSGLLIQTEGDEIDAKILAVLPGQQVQLSEALWEELRDFIQGLFSQSPDLHVSVGKIQSRAQALRYIQEHRET